MVFALVDREIFLSLVIVRNKVISPGGDASEKCVECCSVGS